VVVPCNECNETLDAARVSFRNARRLAFVAANALANGDIIRGRAVLSELNTALAQFDRDSWALSVRSTA